MRRWTPGSPCLKLAAAGGNAFAGDTLCFAADPLSFSSCKQAKFDGDGEFVFVLELPGTEVGADDRVEDVVGCVEADRSAFEGQFGIDFPAGVGPVGGRPDCPDGGGFAGPG